MSMDEAEVRDAARRLLEATGADDAVWAALREAGWPALTTPEALGGLEQPFEAALWLYAELGRALSPAPLLPSLLAVETLCACPPGATRDAWLPRIAAGEAIAASLLAPDANSIAQSPRHALSGAVAAVAGADDAKHALVLCASTNLVALLPLDTPGVRVEQIRFWDTTRRLASLSCDGAVLTDDLILAQGADAAPALAAFSAHLHYAIAADCLGAADGLLAETVAFLNTRRQFDRPLAMFQALKHRCANLKTSIAAASALLASRAASAPPGRRDALALSRGMKAYASAVFRDAAEEAMQLHGGISMTSEHACHRYLTRALLNEHLASADDACDLASAEHLFGAVST